MRPHYVVLKPSSSCFCSAAVGARWLQGATGMSAVARSGTDADWADGAMASGGLSPAFRHPDVRIPLASWSQRQDGEMGRGGVVFENKPATSRAGEDEERGASPAFSWLESARYRCVGREIAKPN